jgi:hypothetical protein
MQALNRRTRGSVLKKRGIAALLSLVAAILPAQSPRAHGNALPS